MKYVLSIITLCVLLLTSVEVKNNFFPITFEYKTLIFNTEKFVSDAENTTIKYEESKILEMGLLGWDLCTSYLEVETVHPNFGNVAYVTGLQPNTRPSKLILIFKRKI